MSLEFCPVPAKIAAIRRYFGEDALFEVETETVLPVMPGQFVELSLAGVGAFPVSLASYPRGKILELCIRKAGRVTAALHRMRVADDVGIRGPFGKGFPVQRFEGHHVLLVAGGLGIAPLRGLLQYLMSRRSLYGEIVLLYGARQPEAILFAEELAVLGVKKSLQVRFTVDFATEIPWGRPDSVCALGLVTDLMRSVGLPRDQTVAAVCGPPGMYRCVLEELLSLGLSPGDIFVSLERHMKCGVGQCCHCVVGGVPICREGPVFSLETLQSLEGAL